MSIKVKLAGRREFGGKSSNAILVMNGTEGRMSVTLREVNVAGKSKRKVREMLAAKYSLAQIAKATGKTLKHVKRIAKQEQTP